MTGDEDQARDAAMRLAPGVPRETWDALDRFAVLLRDEAKRQNLVAASTINALWARHILDSVQLVRWDPGGALVDLGSGAGFPGVVMAALRSDPVTLVESRRLRAAFLERAVDEMGLGARVTIAARRVEMIEGEYAAISARAFAPLDRLLALAHHLSHRHTVWLLPKGRGARDEVEAARRSWQGDFRVEPSVTDPESGVIVASGVAPRHSAGAPA